MGILFVPFRVDAREELSNSQEVPCGFPVSLQQTFLSRRMNTAYIKKFT